ncbi:alpha-amylase [uncultured Alistipes sp.]|uniref:alpha-amylase n=1 Tax=Alistipes sp. TaxID=1872444 RepID=UPI00266B528B|nr:alpha-amylase [uncultured Alistipes sp.]
MENGVMMQYFEWNLPNDGALWRRLKGDASHLRQVGVTSVWIPPAYKADEQQDEGYATYDLYDLGEFDQKGTVRTKYGTRAELQEAIAELHRCGISVYLDAVMNHKTGADYTERFTVREVDPSDREHLLSGPYEIEGCTGFDFPGRGDRYSGFKWHWYHFTGTDLNAANGKKGIYLIQGEGKAWSEGVDDENGNYDFLMFNDLDFDHPDVVAEMERWGVWVARELDLDGMRLDALKHIEDRFIAGFMDAVRRERGEAFYAVGEYWKDGFEALEKYLDVVGHKVNLFDVPLHYKLFEASQKGRDYDLTNLLDQTLVTVYPTLAVTFVDNHDSQRGSSLESQVKAWFKPLAYGLILLMKEGYPCVFFGDYYGTGGQPSPHRVILDILLDARRRFAHGEQKEYFDHPNTVGFTRLGDGEHPGSGLAALLSNGEDGEKRMEVGQAHKGEQWVEITGSFPGEQIAVGDDGRAVFRVHGGKLAVWVPKG